MSNNKPTPPPDKIYSVLFLLSSEADRENMRLISQYLLKFRSNCKVLGLALERRLSRDNINIVNIWDRSNRHPVEILRAINPAVIVTGDDAGIPYRAFVEAAKFLNIPTLLVVPGIIVGIAPFSIKNFESGFWLARNMCSMQERCQILWASLRDSNKSTLRSALFMLRLCIAKFYNNTLYGQSGCSQIAVPGNHTRELLIKRQVPPEKIVVTGLPRFDNISNEKFDGLALRKLLKLDPDKPIVSLLTDAQVEHRFWTSKQRRHFIFQVLASIKECLDVQLVIKVHPYEDPTDYERAVVASGLNIPVSKDIPLYNLINVSNVVMTGLSTTGLETLLLNKPLIILNYYNQIEYIPYVSQGAAIGISNPRDLPLAIRDVLQGEQTRGKLASMRADFLYNHLYLQDGQASERVANLILSMTPRYYGDSLASIRTKV